MFAPRFALLPGLLAVMCAAAVPSGTRMLQTVSVPPLQARHCYFQLSATSGYPSLSPGDFNFTLVPALNGAAGAISLQSVNYPGKYVGPCADGNITGVEANRLCVVDQDALPVDDASFAVLPGLASSSLYSFQSLSKGTLGGSYIAIAESPQSGKCAPFPSPAADIVLASSPSPADATWDLIDPPPPIINVDASAMTHTIPRLYLGCHSDSGYSHQTRGFYSQLIFGEVFEYGLWPNNISIGTITGQRVLDPAVPFGVPNMSSLLLSASGGTGTFGIANRGFGNHGYALKAGKPYEGYFYAKGTAGSTSSISVSFANTDTGNILDEGLLTFTAPDTNEWTKLNFTLTPSEDTICVGIQNGSDPNVNCGGLPDPSYICFRCNGEFRIGLASSPASVNIAYVYLEPGQWGRVPGMPVLADSVQWLVDIGITAIRQGGSFTQGAYYEWKNWIGSTPFRPSLGSIWASDLISGWGPVEMINLCEYLNITPILTTSMLSSPADFSDLVSYLFAEPADSEWASVRANTGHPAPYNKSADWFFELGNEQDNFNFPQQVAAMEAAAGPLGMKGKLHYLYPNNPGPPQSMLKELEALGLGTQIATDLHVGSGGAVEAAASLFNANPNFSQGAVNLETNARIHDFSRAMYEAMDLNDFFNANQPRLLARTASFCTAFASNLDDGWPCPQGLIYFLPNMTWAMPPGYVHKMIKDTYAGGMLSISSPAVSQSSLNKILSASLSDDGHSLVLRFANQGASTTSYTVNIIGLSAVGANTSVVCLQSDDMQGVNTPAQPTLISPQQGPSFAWNGTVTLPLQSYCVFTLSV